VRLRHETHGFRCPDDAIMLVRTLARALLENPIGSWPQPDLRETHMESSKRVTVSLEMPSRFEMLEKADVIVRVVAGSS
jgi:hypothetical protein